MGVNMNLINIGGDAIGGTLVAGDDNVIIINNDAIPSNSKIGEQAVEHPAKIENEKIRLKSCMEDIFTSEDELREFCFEHFKDVHRNLKGTDRWAHIAIEIIRYCESRGTTDELWGLMRQRSPKNTAKYEV